jgi:hypothetical protein
MRRDPRVKSWQRARVERRQRAVARLWRLRMERMTRSAGRFPDTRATPYGDVQSGPRFDDHGRALLALVLLLAVVAATFLGLATAGHDVLGPIRPLPAVRRHTVLICVQRGESMRAVVAVLQRRGLVADASYFYWYWYLRPAALRAGLRVAPGPHTLHTGMTPDALAQALEQSPTMALRALACRAPRRRPLVATYASHR